MSETAEMGCEGMSDGALGGRPFVDDVVVGVVHIITSPRGILMRKLETVATAFLKSFVRKPCEITTVRKETR